MKLSIVIPVYNVEKYLEICLQSLLLTQYQKLDLDIILVDDGSTDSSGAICDNYSDKYDHIRTIHQKNVGLSGARNSGIRASSGEYILFLDSDDYLYDGALITLIQCIGNDRPDIVICNSKKFFDGENILYDYNQIQWGIEFHNNVKGEYKKLLFSDNFTTTAWSFVVRRQFIIDNDLFFEPGILHEDDLWSHQIMMAAGTMKYNTTFLYCYRANRNNSIMKVPSFLHIESYVFILDKLQESIASNNCLSTEIILTREKMKQIYLALCFNATDYIKTDKKYYIFENIKKYQFLLKDENSWKNKVLLLTQKLFGVYWCERLVSIYKKKND